MGVCTGNYAPLVDSHARTYYELQYAHIALDKQRGDETNLLNAFEVTLSQGDRFVKLQWSGCILLRRAEALHFPMLRVCTRLQE